MRRNVLILVFAFASQAVPTLAADPVSLPPKVPTRLQSPV